MALSDDLKRALDAVEYAVISSKGMECFRDLPLVAAELRNAYCRAQEVERGAKWKPEDSR